MNDERPGSITEVLLLHHSHLDVGYTHSQPILWQLQSEYIDQAIDWLESTADLPDDQRPKWTCEVSEPVLRWLAGASANDKSRFRALHDAGRIGLGAMRWNTAGMADRAGLERLLDGKAAIEDFLGSPIRVACQHDVNGATWALGDILLDRGVDLFVTAVNVHQGAALESRPGMFLWDTPSGRRIRVFNGHHYTMFDQLFHAWDDSVDRMAEGWTDLEAHLAKRGYGLDFLYLTTTTSPVLWDNAPPNPFLPDLLRRWNESGRGPRIRYATFDDLRERALAVPDEHLPVLRGDWTDYWSDGYGSTPVATAVNQRSKPLLSAAELVAGASSAPMLADARDNVDLFDEHTWGYFDSDPAHPQWQTGEALKLAIAFEGHEQASFALMDGLERLAGNPVADRGVKGVLLVNPSSSPVTVRPTLPAAWFDDHTARSYRASRMFYANRPWGSEFPGAASRAFGAVELPARSWAAVPLDQLAAPTTSGAVSYRVESREVMRREMNSNPEIAHRSAIGILESPFHTLRYQQATGRIISLVDRDQNRELLDTSSDYDFFSFVRERTDPLVEPSRNAFYESNLDREKYDESCWLPWKPIRERASRVVASDVAVFDDRVVLTRQIDAPGATNLTQRIILSAHEPIIGLELDLTLVPDESPQGIYFVFPLALAQGWQAAFDSAGETVRLDDDQVPGSCRNWMATESVAAMWDGSGLAGLLTPDAPLVQLGGFHFGPPLPSIERAANPLLLAWPANNYWDTNFPRLQATPMSLRYGFVSMATPDFDGLRALAEGYRLRPLAWPITTAGRDAGEGLLRG